MSDIFISYARSDRSEAGKLARAFEKLGWSVWWDRDIPAGKAYDDWIEDELDRARCVVVLWSRRSVRKRWVRTEAEEGISRDVLVPILLEDDIKIPLAYRRIQAASLRTWDGDPNSAAFQKIVASVSLILGPPMGAHEPGSTPLRDAATILETKGPPTSQRLSLDLADGIAVEFVSISPGKFKMGSENGREDERPVRTIEVTRGFDLGKYPVTQEQWETVTGDNPSRFKTSPQHPVEQVSWDDVQGFLTRLNQRNDGYEYRLPTEAEWEYAARAGTSGDYAGDLDEMAWYADNSGKERIDAAAIWEKDRGNYYSRLIENDCQTHRVGERQPNGWRLYDMHGNVWEWVRDVYQQDYYSTRPDPDRAPPGPEAKPGSARVVRGGSWSSSAGLCGSACRHRGRPGFGGIDLGFRLSRQKL